MLKVQTTRNFEGFGNGDKYSLGEYFWSQGMGKSLNGICGRWRASATQNNTTTGLSGLDIMNWFTQKTRNSSSNVDAFAMNSNGWIWKSELGLLSWALAYRPGISNSGNGMIGDGKNRVLYAGWRYLGMYDGGADYTTGTVSVTNGSAAVVGTGTNWGADMVHKRITFSSQSGTWYRVLSVTDATHLTLTSNYTGTTNATATHTIYVAWHDGDYATTNGSVTWTAKDFGADISPVNTYCQMEQYEDATLILRGNKVCRLNSDDSFNDESNPAFDMPTNFVGRSISANKNGILMGFNIGARSVLVLWDNYSTRSIAPWIWLNATVLTIIPYGANWIVITNREIILTNGYTTETLGNSIDSTFTSLDFYTLPQGAIIVRDKLVLSNSQSRYNRGRSGLQIFDLKTRLWEYVAPNNHSVGLIMGAIFNDSSLSTHISFGTSYPAYNWIGTLNAGASDTLIYITQPLGEGSNDKSSEMIKAELGIDEISYSSSNNFGFSITAYVANMKRTMWGYAQQKVLATEYDKLTVDGTVYSYAQVGDQVLITQGLNAGQVRNITAISGAGTSTCVYTLDEALSNYVEQYALLLFSPFQKVKKYTVSNPTEMKEMYFSIKNKVSGKKFLVQFVITGILNVVPEIRSVSLFYDDKGAI